MPKLNACTRCPGHADPLCQGYEPDAALLIGAGRKLPEAVGRFYANYRILMFAASPSCSTRKRRPKLVCEHPIVTTQAPQLMSTGIVNLSNKVVHLARLEARWTEALRMLSALTPPLPPLLPRSRPGIVADARHGNPLPSDDASLDRSDHGWGRRQTGRIGRAQLT